MGRVSRAVAETQENGRCCLASSSPCLLVHMSSDFCLLLSSSFDKSCSQVLFQYSILTLIKYIADIEEYLNPLCLHCGSGLEWHGISNLIKLNAI
jgi:hypothetical protein